VGQPKNGRNAGGEQLGGQRAARGSDRAQEGGVVPSSRLHQARTLVRELARAASRRGRRREERRWHGALAGLAVTYRWARETFLRAYERGDDAGFRSWRTAVKYHALHLRLLAERWPEQLTGRLEVLQRLAELLGQDQMLAVFASEVVPERKTATPAVVGPTGSVADLRGLVEQRHQALRALARPLGRRLFSDPPAIFRKRLQACWQLAREPLRSARLAA
jgi:hypothetical protein